MQKARISEHLFWVWGGLGGGVYRIYDTSICFFFFKYLVLQLITTIFPHGPPVLRIDHDFIIKDYKRVEILKIYLMIFLKGEEI